MKTGLWEKEVGEETETETEKERVRKMELAVSGNEEEREEATAELIAVTMKKAEGSEGGGNSK